MTVPTASPFFTIFTPTYNRAHTLHRVFDSLHAQTFRDFEWLVIDDGSTDNTRELIDAWTKTADFPIRYLQQPHLGRHFADNLAIRELRGEMYTGIDSDDALMPDALEKMWRVWCEIPEPERSSFSGILGHCHDQHGNLVGRMFPTSPLDCKWHEFVFVHHRFGGQKSGAFRTNVARPHSSPEIEGTNFVPEGLTGLQNSRVHQRKIRCVNEIFQIYNVSSGLTGATLTGRRNVAKSAPGRLHYYLYLLNNEMEYFRHAPGPFIKAAAMLPLVTRYAGRSPRGVWRELENWRAKLLVLAVLPLSLLLGIFLKLIGQSK